MQSRAESLFLMLSDLNEQLGYQAFARISLVVSKKVSNSLLFLHQKISIFYLAPLTTPLKP